MYLMSKQQTFLIPVYVHPLVIFTNIHPFFMFTMAFRSNHQTIEKNIKIFDHDLFDLNLAIKLHKFLTEAYVIHIFDKYQLILVFLVSITIHI